MRRPRSMECLYLRQLERIYELFHTKSVLVLIRSSDRISLPAPMSSSLRTESRVRHVQTDHNSTYDDQKNRDQCQLKPTKRCCPFKYRSPVDFVTKPSPRNHVGNEADPHCSGNK